MTSEDIKKLAAQAKIEISESELEKYAKSLTAFEDSSGIISGVNTEAAQPATHVTQLRNVWRADIVKPLSGEAFKQMMSQAPQTEGAFYKVEKIIETE